MFVLKLPFSVDISKIKEENKSKLYNYNWSDVEKTIKAQINSVVTTIYVLKYANQLSRRLDNHANPGHCSLQIVH